MSIAVSFRYDLSESNMRPVLNVQHPLFEADDMNTVQLLGSKSFLRVMDELVVDTEASQAVAVAYYYTPSGLLRLVRQSPWPSGVRTPPGFSASQVEWHGKEDSKAAFSWVFVGMLGVFTVMFNSIFSTPLGATGRARVVVEGKFICWVTYREGDPL